METQDILELALNAHVGARRADPGLGTRMLSRLSQLYCGLHGHDSLIQFEKTRVFLKCVSCGHESPGWALTQPRPKAVFHGDALRHAMPRQPMLAARRIA